MESHSLEVPWMMMIEGVAYHRVGPMMASDLKAYLPLPLRRPKVRYSTLQAVLYRRYRRIRGLVADLPLSFVHLWRFAHRHWLDLQAV